MHRNRLRGFIKGDMIIIRYMGGINKMAKASKAQTTAVKKYQSKMHRVTILLDDKTYNLMISAIKPLSKSAYIKALIDADICERLRILQLRRT